MDQVQYSVSVVITCALTILLAKYPGNLGKAGYVMVLSIFHPLLIIATLFVPQSWSILVSTKWTVSIFSTLAIVASIVYALRILDGQEEAIKLEESKDLSINEYAETSSSASALPLTVTLSDTSIQTADSTDESQTDSLVPDAKGEIEALESSDIESRFESENDERDNEDSLGKVANPSVQSRSEIEQIAMNYVSGFETRKRRTVEDVSHLFIGYDFQSYAQNSQDFYAIEVKGKSKPGAIVMTSNEWKTAQQMTDEYYLYIVDGIKVVRPRLRIIQNPTRANYTISKNQFLLKRTVYRRNEVKRM